MFQEMDPISLLVLVTLLGLVPFIGVMVTSFVKLVVVFSLLRNALGIQQVPPNMAMHGLALVLSAYIMAPVFYNTYLMVAESDKEIKNIEDILVVVGEAHKPFTDFLLKNSEQRNLHFFYNTSKKLWGEELSRHVTEESVLILVPSFTLSQLTSAFEVGFLVYLPFIAIDMIISNILLAMGMMMVSPMMVSLPFKLFLFVMADGWNRLVRSLVLSYQ